MLSFRIGMEQWGEGGVPTLEFAGKHLITQHHRMVPIRNLVPDPSKSVPSKNTGTDSSLDDNLIIHGDNLHALKALLPRYAGRVNCIYIDPPYNTGNENWAYNDNVNNPQIKEWLGKNVGTDDLERHDKWLAMMWPRLTLLRELLADNGVIFVSIDDNEQHHLRMMLDEVFGEENFVANIVWNHRKSSQNDIDVSLSHNHVVCYALSRPSFSFNAGGIDESKFSNPDNDLRGPWVADPMDAPNVRPNLTYEITNPNTGKVYLPPLGRCWRFTQEKYVAAFNDGRIVFGKTGRAGPQHKRFLSEAQARGTSISTIWDDVGTATEATQELQRIFEQRQVFSTPKPSALLKKIVQSATNNDSIVLDSFAGSGTTAHAVLALNKEDGGNRKFILVECMEYSDTITAERVRRLIHVLHAGRGNRVGQGSYRRESPHLQ